MSGARAVWRPCGLAAGTLLCLAGCGRGLYGDPTAVGMQASDAAVDATALVDGDPPRGHDAPLAADGALLADAPLSAPDAPASVSDAAAGAGDHVGTDGALPPGTTWEPCAQLGMAWPRALAYTPDGKQLLIANADGQFGFFGLDGNAGLYNENDLGQVLKVAVSPDGAFFAGLSYNQVQVWHTQDKDKSFAGTGLYARTAVFSKKSPNLLLVTSEAPTGNVNVWRVSQQQPAGVVLSLVGGFTGPPDAAFAPDGVSLLLVDGKQLVTSDFTGKNQHANALKLPIVGPVFSPDGSLLAGRTADGQLAVYRTADGTLATNAPLPAAADRLAFVGSTKVVALGGTEGHVFSIADGLWRQRLAFPAPLADADAAPDGSALAAVTTLGQVVRLSLADGGALSAPTVDWVANGGVTALMTSSDGRRLAVGGGHNVVWELGRNLEIAELPYRPLAFQPDGAHLVLTDYSCWVYDLATAMFKVMPDDCQASITFKPDGSAFATTSPKGVQVFAGGKNTMLRALGVFPAVRFSADGAWLASSGNQLWSTSDWKNVWPSMPPDSPPGVTADPADYLGSDNSVAFSPDGTRVLLSTSVRTSGSPGIPWQTITRLRAAKDGTLLHDFGNTLERAPSFSPDGAWIAAGASVVYGSGDITRRLDPATTVSTFLSDGRIAAGQPDDRVVLYCPH